MHDKRKDHISDGNHCPPLIREDFICTDQTVPGTDESADKDQYTKNILSKTYEDHWSQYNLVGYQSSDRIVNQFDEVEVFLLWVVIRRASNECACIKHHISVI